MSLDGGFEEMGQFWLAGDGEPEHPMPGKITVDENGFATVQVFSAFTAEDESFLKPLGGIPAPHRILGITETNKTVTLDDVSATRLGGFTVGKKSGVRRRQFWSDQVLFGRHYGENEPIRFDRVAFSIELAYEWFGRSGIEPKYYSYDNPLKMIIEYERPRQIDLRFADGSSGQVWFDVKNFAPPMPWNQKLDVEQTCSIVLDAPEDRWELREVHDLAVYVQAFIAIATGLPVAVAEIIASVEVEDHDSETRTRDRMTVPYRPYRVGQPVTDKTTPLQMPFIYSDVEDVFDKMLGNWLEFCRTRHHGILSAMESRYGKLTVDDHLRALSRSIEVLVGKDVGGETYFKDLVKHLAVEYTAECGKTLDADAFALAVRDYRNWFTHYDKDKRYQARTVDYAEVQAICANLTAMLNLYMIDRCLPNDMTYRDLVCPDGELKWPLRKLLQFHKKHRKPKSSDGRQDVSAT